MTCGLCKHPIAGNEHYTTDHYKCSVDLANSFRADIARLAAERDEAIGILRQIDGEMRAGFGSSFGETREAIKRVLARVEASR